MPLFTAKQRLILTGKSYLVDIYERSKHSKSHEDWIKNSCVVVSESLKSTPGTWQF
jgi:hypothetical protein